MSSQNAGVFLCNAGVFCAWLIFLPIRSCVFQPRKEPPIFTPHYPAFEKYPRIYINVKVIGL